MNREDLTWCNQGCCGQKKSLDEWRRYDVPVTFSVLAPAPEAAMAYVRQCMPYVNDRVLQPPHLADSPAYNTDHAFVDGAEARLCECGGH